MGSLLINNFKFIFLHLVRNGQQEDLTSASVFLKVRMCIRMYSTYFGKMCTSIVLRMSSACIVFTECITPVVRGRF